MKRPTSRQLFSLRRFPLWVALSLIFVLTAHVFDDCMPHFGLPASAKSSLVLANCSLPESASCGSCSLHPIDKSNADGCDSQSEIAIPTSSFSPDQLPFNLVTIAVLPAPQHLVSLASGSLLGRAEPPPTHFVSSSLRSSLPNRAPPSV